MRDKKVKRKNKQKEDRFIQLKKQLDEYWYINSCNNGLSLRKYWDGYVSFFKNKDELLEYSEYR